MYSVHVVVNLRFTITEQNFLSLLGTETSLPVEAFECQVCFDLVVNAVHCVKCGQFLCDHHIFSLTKCPFCRVFPFNVQEDRTLRRLMEQIPLSCPICTLRIRKGDLAVHLNHCQSKSCGANGCVFQSGHKETALRHVIEAHGDRLWQNYTRFTAAGTANINFPLYSYLNPYYIIILLVL